MTSLFTNLFVLAMQPFQKYLLIGGIALLVIAIVAKVLQKK
jgi:hypothetical protein